MSFQGGLLTSEIATIFAEEVAAQGGSVTDRFDDGARLFLRAVLPDETEVQKRDRVQGGVALRATEETAQTGEVVQKTAQTAEAAR